jgi:hypothetical protein
MIYSVLKNLNIESPHIIAFIESLESLFRFLVMTSPALENICSLGTLVAGTLSIKCHSI